MKHPKELIPVLSQLLTGNKRQASFAKYLGVATTFVGSIKRGHNSTGKVQFPAGRRPDLIADLNRIFPSVDFSTADLDLSAEQFLERLPPGHPKTEELLAEFPDLARRPNADAHSLLAILKGKYVRLYLCHDPERQNQPSVALDDFEFVLSRQAGEMIVHQRTFIHPIEPGVPLQPSQMPKGILRIVGLDTIEMRIDYPHPRDPDASYLALLPRREKASILAMALDIRDELRTPFARAVVFIRVDSFFDHADVYGPTTPLYKTAKALFTAAYVLNEDIMQIVPRGLEVDTAAVLEAFRTLSPRKRSRE